VKKRITFNLLEFLAHKQKFLANYLLTSVIFTKQVSEVCTISHVGVSGTQQAYKPTFIHNFIRPTSVSENTTKRII